MNGVAVLVWLTSMVEWVGSRLAPHTVESPRSPVFPDAALVRELLRNRAPLEAELVARGILLDAERTHGTGSLEAAAAGELVLDSVLARHARRTTAREPDGNSAPLAQAQRLAERVVRVRETLAGPLHRSLAVALHKLALVRAARWGDAAAVPPLARAVRILERGGAGNEPLLATILAELSLRHQQCDRPHRAHRLLARAVMLYERAAPHSLELVLALNRLARSYLDQGNPSAARPLLERALDLGDATAAPPLVLAGTAFNLGLVLVTQAELHGAREQFLDALAIEERELRPDDPELASTLIEIGGCEERLGETELARTHLVRALGLLEAAYGPEGEELAAVLAPLARLHALCDEPQRGKPLLVRLLELRRRRLGPVHPDLVVTLNNLAFVSESAGNLVEARQWRERALAVGEAVWGPRAPQLTTTLDALGSLLWAGEDWGACRVVNERLLEIRAAELGAGHPAVAVKHQDIGVLAWRIGERDEAAQQFEAALGILERCTHGERAIAQQIESNLERLARQEADGEGPFTELHARAQLLVRRMVTAPPVPEA